MALGQDETTAEICAARVLIVHRDKELTPERVASFTLVERPPQVSVNCPQCEQPFKVYDEREDGARCDRCLYRGLRGWLITPFLLLASAVGVILRVWDGIRDAARNRR
jgi:DNA-directed RNA polymerase subunit RPC12/RpoP